MIEANRYIECDNKRLDALHAGLQFDSPTIFSDQEIIWEIYKQNAILLGGLRAVLMQVSNPSVAAGVLEHSQFKLQTIKRLKNTVVSMYDIIFGTPEAAKRRTKKMFEIHNKVFGFVGEGSTSKWDNREYRANEPELLHWVAVTTADSILTAFEEFCRPLTKHELDRFVSNYNVVANLLGVGSQHRCSRIEDIRDYYFQQYECGNVHVGKNAKDIYKELKSLGLSWSSSSLLAAKHMPKEVREAYGLTWHESDQLKFEKIKKRVRLLNETVPYSRAYYKARRLSGV